MATNEKPGGEKPTDVRRDGMPRGRPFQKGKDPRRGRGPGFPKTIKQLHALARGWTTEAIQVLADVMLDPETPAKVRVAAADKMLDRGWGRPTVTLASDPENPIDVTVQMGLGQLFQRITGGAFKPPPLPDSEDEPRELPAAPEEPTE